MNEKVKAAMTVIANEVKDLLSQVEERVIEIDRATTRQSGIQVSKERLKNLLFNRREELVKILKDWIRLAEETEALRAALEESDRQIDELERAARKGASKKGGQTEDENGKADDPGLGICTIQ